MKYAILSDVHANLDALDKVVSDARREGAEQIICLGDIVGYGPLPAETLTRVRQIATEVIAGNHDDAVSGRGSAVDFNGLAANAVERHRAALSAGDIDWLRALPYTCTFANARASHGDFVDPPKFYYVDDEEAARANFEVTTEQILFVGHTHAPAVAVTGDSGKVYLLEPQDFVVEPGKRYLINPGSVGYPRAADGTCFSSYVLYDAERQTIVFRFVPFAISSVLTRGTASRQTSHRLRLALISAVLALLVGIGCFLIRPLQPSPSPDATPIPATTEKAEDQLYLARRELTLRPSDRKVRANLRLSGDPVNLTIEFRDAATCRVGDPFQRTVKKSDKTPHAIPQQAVAAIFTLRRLATNGVTRIRDFQPSAGSK